MLILRRTTSLRSRKSWPLESEHQGTLAQVQERFVEGKMAQLDYVGWTMVFVAEVEMLQCACLLYKSWALRLRRRGRAASPYREPSI